MLKTYQIPDYNMPFKKILIYINYIRKASNITAALYFNLYPSIKYVLIPIISKIL